MSVKCVALLSGGLDSMLAVRLMQQQGIQVEALTLKTLYSCCNDGAGRAASFLQVPLTVARQEEDYLEVIRRPRFGYGKGANPCVDCRVYMLRRAASWAEQCGAEFVITGEVLGQRLKSQKRRDLEAVAFHSDLDDRLLRPLSAKLLPPTLPEKTGAVDRQRLYGFHGRGRKGLIRLARRLGFPFIPRRSSGCALAERQFARNVFDLLEFDPQAGWWDFELLRTGRHYRYDERTKVVVGRRETENRALEYLHNRPDARSSALLTPANFAGPAAVLVGPTRDDCIDFAAGLVWRHAKHDQPERAAVHVQTRDRSFRVGVRLTDRLHTAQTVAAVTN